METKTKRELFAAAVRGDLDAVERHLHEPTTLRLVQRTEDSIPADVTPAGHAQFAVDAWFRGIASFDLIFERAVIAHQAHVIEWFFSSVWAMTTIPKTMVLVFVHTALDACRYDADILELLLNSPVYVECMTVDVQTAVLAQLMQGAAEYGTPLAVRSLVSHGASVDVNAELENAYSPLACAAWQFHDSALPMAQLLIDAGADVVTDASALLHASRNGKLDCIRVLLRHGADSRLETREHKQLIGLTALHAAAREGRFDALELLLTDGFANVDASDSDGITALMEAVSSQSNRMTGRYKNCQQRAVNTLLKHGADTNVRDAERQRTALSEAVASKNVVCARFLLEHGADANPRHSDETTPLYALLADGERSAMVLALVELLLRYGADLCVPTLDGDTAYKRLVADKDTGHSWAEQLEKYLLVDDATVPTRKPVTTTGMRLRRPCTQSPIGWWHMLLVATGYT